MPKKQSDTNAKKQLTGMRGVYIVAAELCRRGYNAIVTSRNSFGPDILINNMDISKSFMIQVKTNAKTFSFWLVGDSATKVANKDYFYILVNIRKKRGVDLLPEFYVVPSKIISKLTQYDKAGKWPSFSIIDAEPYKDKWDYFK